MWDDGNMLHRVLKKCNKAQTQLNISVKKKNHLQVSQTEQP